MEQKVKNWGVYILIGAYMECVLYALTGVWRMLEAAFNDSPDAEMTPWLDAWWLAMRDGLREQTVLTLALIIAIIYLFVGLVRMTLCLGTKYATSDADTVQYRPVLDAWWCELSYQLGRLLALIRKPIHH